MFNQRDRNREAKLARRLEATLRRVLSLAIVESENMPGPSIPEGSLAEIDEIRRDCEIIPNLIKHAAVYNCSILPALKQLAREYDLDYISPRIR